MSSTATQTKWSIPKTVLGDKIYWDTSKIPGQKKGTFSGKDDQLWRCRKTKKFEAGLLKNLPPGASFVDAGAHFGDTTLTMAIHARDALGRTDLRFFAFEPNARKASFIEDCAAANGFGEDTFRVICCVVGDETLQGKVKARQNDAANWCRYDGRTSYEFVNGDSGVENSRVVDVVPSSDSRASDICESDDDSSTSTSSSASSVCLLDVRQLDDFFSEIQPLGFLHVDVEGWEAKVLKGASKLLADATQKGGGPCYVLAESFEPSVAKRRGEGFSLTHENDVVNAMKDFPDLSRGEDVVDGERNLFFSSSADDP